MTPDDNIYVHYVMGATSPHDSAIGVTDRRAVVVKKAFISLHEAERFAGALKAQVFTALGSNASANRDYIDRMLDYRDSITITSRNMTPVV